ncbi:MAG: hypothetical protein Alpg2KO_23940 [Alphaproteobacteria bacterium]
MAKSGSTLPSTVVQRVIGLCLLVTGIIHILPVMGILGGDRLAQLYDIEIATDNLSILLRHRAVLFGLLGAFLCLAAFRKHLQSLAVIGGLTSVVSFLVLALLEPDYTAPLQKIVLADLIALACLLIAGGLLGLQSRDDSADTPSATEE